MTDYAAMLLADWELRDDLTLVTLVNGVTGDETADVQAKNRAFNFREASLGGAIGLEPTDCVWMLGCRSLGEATPTRGDKIVAADGTTWTLLSVATTTFGDTPIYHECTSRRQY